MQAIASASDVAAGSAQGEDWSSAQLEALFVLPFDAALLERLGLKAM